MPDSTAGLIVTVGLALVGLAAKYLNDIRIEQKKAEIKLVSEQIERLYGPLSALTEANEAAWKSFTNKYFPGRDSVFETPLSEQESAVWRQWMEEVFMPLNRTIVDIILKNTHLIDGSQFPLSFSEMIAHVKTYETVLTKWSRGNFSELTAFSNYPDGINRYARDKFKKIKARQVKLLAQRSGPRWSW